MKKILYIGLDAAPDAGLVQKLKGSEYQVTVCSMNDYAAYIHSGNGSVAAVIIESVHFALREDEALWKLKKGLPDAPVILLAHHISVESYLRSLALGIHEYLCRPVTDTEVLRSLGTALEEDRTLALSHEEESRTDKRLS